MGITTRLRRGAADKPAIDMQAKDKPILEVEDLHTYFFTDKGVVHAVDGVSFHVQAGETLGIVGESGSGKSVTASSVMRLVAPPGKIVGGKIRLGGRDIESLPDDQVRALRGGNMAMIFQDPMTSLNPVLRISRQLEEAMLVHGRYDRKTAAGRAIELLGKMGITAPARAVRNYPHQFSGGMRQRVMLAMGFGNDPGLLIADEPTTALDVTVQAQILDLLRELNRDYGVAIILISHDLGVVANICGRVAVMYAGKIVETGPTTEILRNPQHPYTWALLNAVPRIDGHGRRRLLAIPGFPPDLIDPPSGCRFMPRCPFRIDKCAELPPLMDVGPGRMAACWVTASGVQLPQVTREGTQLEVLERADGSIVLDTLPGPETSANVVDDSAPPDVRVAIAEEATRAADLDDAGEALATAPLTEMLQTVRAGTSRDGYTATGAAVTESPRESAAEPGLGAPLALELVDVKKWFTIERGGIGRAEKNVRAVDGVDLFVRQGETLGLVGESGSGKSTLARLVVRLHQVTEGRILFEGRDITRLPSRQMRPLRRRLQMIFQDP
jgi:peptide/nickel transport system ATP-binding protein